MINYYAIIVGTIIAMAFGAIWHGPIFGKRWSRIIGADKLSEVERKKLQKESMKFIIFQLFLTLLQVFILAYFVSSSIDGSGIKISLLIWAAFVIPTIAGSIMWTLDKRKLERFFIQAGYQVIIFIIFGLLLEFWK